MSEKPVRFAKIVSFLIVFTVFRQKTPKKFARSARDCTLNIDLTSGAENSARKTRFLTFFMKNF